MSGSQREPLEKTPNGSFNIGGRKVEITPLNYSEQIQNDSQIELGTITFGQFAWMCENPPKQIVIGFDITPQDEAMFRKFLESPKS
jgi:hypothetical protein